VNVAFLQSYFALAVLAAVALAAEPSVPIRPTPITPAPGQSKGVETLRPVSPAEKSAVRLDAPVIESFNILPPLCSRPIPNTSLFSYRVSNATQVRINQIVNQGSGEEVVPVYSRNGGPRLEDSGIGDPQPRVTAVAYVLVATAPTGQQLSRRIAFNYRSELEFSLLSGELRREPVADLLRFSIPARIRGVIDSWSVTGRDIATFVSWSPTLGDIMPEPPPYLSDRSSASSVITFTRPLTRSRLDHAAAQVTIALNPKRPPGSRCGFTSVSQTATLRADAGCDIYGDCPIRLKEKLPGP